ncbi:DUF342 domain-containing protein [Pseudoalteromonas sp.]|uniref:DUF342 domain-containing protein n=1 Tax=Pseudoalteromonas sp. TaxID=53249 RepID=UPI0035669FF7
MASFSFDYNKDTRELDLIIQEVEKSPKPELKKIKQLFEQSDFRNMLLNENNLKKLIDSLEQDQLDEPSHKLSATIATTKDADMSLTVSPDEMTASIEITCAFAGKHINETDIVNLLIENGIKKTANKDMIVQLVNQAKTAKPGEQVSQIVANGKLAVNGENGYINYLVPDPSDRKLCPKLLENGNVDMRELGELCYVQKGKKLAELVPPTLGEKGFTVLEKPLEPEAGQAATLSESEGSVFADELESTLIADFDGMPKHEPNGVSVVKVFNINNIDVSTGNIRFDGTIMVQGDICEGYKARASGDIIVAGSVESAYVEAGGSVSIGKGVIGHAIENTDEEDKSCTIIAGGNINVHHVQYVNLFANGDIHVSQFASHCKFCVRGHFWVGKDENPNGKVVSCDILVGKSVSAGSLGSRSGTHMLINFNYSFAGLEQTYKALIERKHLYLAKVRKVKYLIAQLTSRNENCSEKLARLKKTLVRYLDAIDKLVIVIEAKNNKLSLHRSDITIIATQALLTGVEICIEQKHLVCNRDYGPSKITYLDNEIKLDPLT